MSATIIAFFNNKGGVGKTTLVYHLAWMYQNLGAKVIAADLDPQSNLTAAFLDEDRLAELWPVGDHPRSLFGAIQPLMRGLGDISPIEVEPISNRLGLLVGDLALGRFEDRLSAAWPLCLNRDEAAFRSTSAFWRVMQQAAAKQGASIVLMDVGPNLGAINRAALLAADYVVVPVAPDLFSLQGLRNLGPTLREWREDWSSRLAAAPPFDFQLPSAKMEPAGYLVQLNSIRLDRPARAFERWIEKFPQVYRECVLDQPGAAPAGLKNDPHCLAQIKNYRSLIPMAQESRKPMFSLRPADGAMGSHFLAAQDAGRDFKELALKIAARCGVSVPDSQSPARTPAGSSSSAGRS